jgi:NADH dehydrogenase FAD-containing subunit
MPGIEPARVVIVGGGFGGLSAARALARQQVRITLVDRTNHHVFQPLLYQVATAVLAPGQIASPIRQVLRRQANASVLLAEVTGVDPAARVVHTATPEGDVRDIPYDVLILATGVQQSYFGHDEFARFAPALKTLEDATAIRSRILAAFERAEATEAPEAITDPERRAPLLTFVLVGAGPTGVEMAGALAELARLTLRGEFRRIDPRAARIVLVEAGPRILPTFGEGLAARVHARLTGMGVEVRTGHAVESVDAQGAIVGGERIAAATVLWTAGVRPSPVAAWLAAGDRAGGVDRTGRVAVEPDLTVPGHPEIFVVGDVAACERDGRQLPGVAQVAIQQGRYAARVLAARLSGAPPPPPFRYRDKGNLAVVGRNYAVLEAKRLHLAGWPAWLVWAAIHLEYLALFNNKLLVFAQWAWSYFTAQRGSRLILGRH